jgi:hypothetical protein
MRDRTLRTAHRILIALDRGTSADAAFNWLEGIAFDHDGNLFAASGQNVEGLAAR